MGQPSPTLMLKGAYLVIDVPDDRIDSPYDPEDLALLASKVGLSALSPKHAGELEHAALYYFFEAELEAKPGSGEKWRPLLPSRSEQRTALRRIAEAARSLKIALADQAILFLNKKYQLPALKAKVLDELAAAADRAAEQVPRGGADPKLARIKFVRQLAEIYEGITQQPATRQHDALSGLDCGPFLDFVRAALKPLNPSALKGLEHDVRHVAEERPSGQRD